MNRYLSLEIKPNKMIKLILKFENCFKKICVEKTQNSKQLKFLCINVWIALT